MGKTKLKKQKLIFEDIDAIADCNRTVLLGALDGQPSNSLKSIEAPCCVCGGHSTVGVTGVSNGKITNEHYCDSDYQKLKRGINVKRTGMGKDRIKDS